MNFGLAASARFARARAVPYFARGRDSKYRARARDLVFTHVYARQKHAPVCERAPGISTTWFQHGGKYLPSPPCWIDKPVICCMVQHQTSPRNKYTQATGVWQPGCIYFSVRSRSMRSRTACKIYPCKLCPAAAAAALIRSASGASGFMQICLHFALYLSLFLRFDSDTGNYITSLFVIISHLLSTA